MLCQFQVYRKVILLYIYIYSFFFRFLTHVGYYRILSRVPCAIQQVLVGYLFYIQQCIYVNPNLPIHPTTTRLPNYTVKVKGSNGTKISDFLSNALFYSHIHTLTCPQFPSFIKQWHYAYEKMCHKLLGTNCAKEGKEEWN